MDEPCPLCRISMLTAASCCVVEGCPARYGSGPSPMERVTCGELVEAEKRVPPTVVWMRLEKIGDEWKWVTRTFDDVEDTKPAIVFEASPKAILRGLRQVCGSLVGKKVR